MVNADQLKNTLTVILFDESSLGYHLKSTRLHTVIQIEARDLFQIVVDFAVLLQKTRQIFVDVLSQLLKFGTFAMQAFSFHFIFQFHLVIQRRLVLEQFVVLTAFHYFGIDTAKGREKKREMLPLTFGQFGKLNTKKIPKSKDSRND